jgi:hypothetical protein
MQRRASNVLHGARLQAAAVNGDCGAGNGYLRARAASVVAELKNQLHAQYHNRGGSGENRRKHVQPSSAVLILQRVFFLWDFIERVQVAEPELQQLMHVHVQTVTNKFTAGSLRTHSGARADMISSNSSSSSLMATESCCTSILVNVRALRLRDDVAAVASLR